MPLRVEFIFRAVQQSDDIRPVLVKRKQRDDHAKDHQLYISVFRKTIAPYKTMNDDQEEGLRNGIQRGK